MNERASYREFVLLHMDPVKVGVCVRRSVQSGEMEDEVLTLRFWAHSIMQGPPDWLNMMGGLMSGAAVCSKVRPTGWLGIDVSAIICNKATMLVMTPWSQTTRVHLNCTEMWLMMIYYPWWLEPCVYCSVRYIFGLYDTHNFSDNLICWHKYEFELRIIHVKNWLTITQLYGWNIPLLRRTSLQDSCELKKEKKNIVNELWVSMSKLRENR